MSACFVIAEAGVNHNGSEKLALELIEVAAKSGADAIKFQTFTAETLVAKGTATAEYQKQETGNLDQFSMLKKLELSDAIYQKLIEHCDKCGIEFMSTPFDIGAAKFLLDRGMDRIKVPSGELTNLPFICELAAFDKPIILSTGMADLSEVADAVEAIAGLREEQNFSRPLEEMLTILHCTSNYPAKSEDVNLRAMVTMAQKFRLPVGYSDHTDGTLISVAAVSMGARVIEKHFTLDKTLAGPDHRASLEPKELELMIQQIRQVEASLGDGLKKPRANELPVRELVRRSVTLAVDKAEGEEISADELILLRPGTGIPPKELNQVVGMKLKKSHMAGDTLNWQDLI
jgi:N,N'-diacetyllegionaminate synthase